MILNEKFLEELLDYLDNSISKLALETLESSEFHISSNLDDFLSSQYDIRLENLLRKKNSDIHHLESGMKNKVIQRKNKLLERLKHSKN